MSVAGLKAGLGVCGIGNFGVGGGDIQLLKEITETGDVISWEDLFATVLGWLA